MSVENAEPWSEKWEHDRWLKIQEMGDDFYKEEEDDKEMERDPFEEEERRRWQEEEEKAKEAYFQMIKEEEERGNFRQTVSELIEETSGERKLMKEIEKEEEEKGANAAAEAEVSPDKEKKEDKGRKEEGASIDSPLRLCDPLTFRPTDSLTNFDASIQKTNLNSLQAVVEMEQREADESSQELDVGLQLYDTDQAVVEIEQREASESSQELDKGLQLDDTGQVTEYHLEDKKVKERMEEEEEKEKKIPK